MGKENWFPLCKSWKKGKNKNNWVLMALMPSKILNFNEYHNILVSWLVILFAIL
jgi:hypothetical protein